MRQTQTIFPALALLALASCADAPAKSEDPISKVHDQVFGYMYLEVCDPDFPIHLSKDDGRQIGQEAYQVFLAKREQDHPGAPENKKQADHDLMHWMESAMAEASTAIKTQGCQAPAVRATLEAFEADLRKLQPDK